MMTMSNYLAETYFAMADSKSPEEFEEHKAEHHRRIAWYKSQNLPTSLDPDGSWSDLDEGTKHWSKPEDYRGPELWPDGWNPREPIEGDDPTPQQ